MTKLALSTCFSD